MWVTSPPNTIEWQTPVRDVVFRDEWDGSWSWAPVPGAIGYEVCVLTDCAITTDTEFTSDVPDNSQVKIYITPQYPGELEWYAARTIEISPIIFLAPVRDDVVTGDAVTIAWTPNADPDVIYNLWMTNLTIDDILLDSVTSATSYELTDLPTEPGTYQYRVWLRVFTDRSQPWIPDILDFTYVVE